MYNKNEYNFEKYNHQTLWCRLSTGDPAALMERLQCVGDTAYLLYQNTKDKSGYG